jgi:hypothetical protein
VTCTLSGEAAAGRQLGALTQTQETTLKKSVMCIIAVALSLVGSANFAMAQAFLDDGVVTGSERTRMPTAVLTPAATSNSFDPRRGATPAATARGHRTSIRGVDFDDAADRAIERPCIDRP